jgi:hypothetical protein
MSSERSMPSDQDLAVEFLARETHLPVGDVEKLYVNEMAKLALGAHIKNFLSIFAIRNVRRLLIARAAAKSKRKSTATYQRLVGARATAKLVPV